MYKDDMSNGKVIVSYRCEILLILMSCIMFDDTNHSPAVFWREWFLQGFHCEQRVQKLENCSLSSADIEIQLLSYTLLYHNVIKEIYVD